MENVVQCPICSRDFGKQSIEEHVNKCLFLNSQNTANVKRSGSDLEDSFTKPKKLSKKQKEPECSSSSIVSQSTSPNPSYQASKTNEVKKVPLAEQMRPMTLEDMVGQSKAFGPGSMLRSMIEQKKIPSMILWGPPGCGKTSLANIISAICKQHANLRFIKLSATMAGINDVKEVVKVAKNEAQYKRQTVLFMDEIHRFNKLQQDTFLPHVENGTIILIGATTENPSFSLNNALLSRCKVIVMDKLTADDIMVILERAVERDVSVAISDAKGKLEKKKSDYIPRYIIERASLRWLAEMCDGDARQALGALELVLSARDPGPEIHVTGPALITLDDIQDGIKRSHMVYDKRGDEHYNIISALHKSIRASDENAALYWVTRAMHCGEDPLYIARRLIVCSCEDIGLADSSAIVEAVACLHGCQHLGMPDCDVLLAQCAVRLARAPKSRHVYDAMRKCQRFLKESKGPIPPVPLHLRNAPTKLLKQIGAGRGYNMRNKDESGLAYMPEGLEDVDFFDSDCDT